jgi:hypothetical protein
MPRSINGETRRRQRRVARALRRDHAAPAQVQVALAPDARVLVDDAVFGDGIGIGGGRLGLGLGVVAVVAVAVVPVVAAGVAVVVVAVLVDGGVVVVGVVGGGGVVAELAGPIGAADV